MGKEDIFERIEKKTNVNKDTIIKLAKELENGNFKDENTLRNIIGEISAITGKTVSKEKEDKIVNMVISDKVPKDIDKREVIILDPMLATGGSGLDAIELLKKEGVTEIKFLCIIAAPEGIERIEKTHPDVQIYCAAIDEKLNENAYIVPGLGDAGDRIFGTK